MSRRPGGTRPADGRPSSWTGMLPGWRVRTPAPTFLASNAAPAGILWAAADPNHMVGDFLGSGTALAPPMPQLGSTRASNCQTRHHSPLDRRHHRSGTRTRSVLRSRMHPSQARANVVSGTPTRVYLGGMTRAHRQHERNAGSACHSAPNSSDRDAGGRGDSARPSRVEAVTRSTTTTPSPVGASIFLGGNAGSRR